MAKDPAFLFYPGDFNTGTQFFTDEQVGKYMRLLMAQHQHGHLPEKHMIFICKSYDKDIFSKFTQDPEGLWYNERLEIEVEKRKKYTQSRSENKSGKTKEKIISKSYDFHMENKNRNGIGINNKREEDFYKTNEEAHSDIMGNYIETDHALSILTNRGWTSATDFDVGALLFHFLASQPDLGTQTKDNVRSHFKRWLNKQPVDVMIKLVLSIKLKYERGKRQSTEVRGTTNGIPGTG